MADTIPDVSVALANYVDINTLSGIAAGIALVITNKSNVKIRLQIAATQPADDSEGGEILWPGPHSTSIKLISAAEGTIWAKAVGLGNALISVQDNT